VKPATVFDVGNTRLKWAHVEAGKVVGRGSVPWETAGDWRPHVDRLGFRCGAADEAWIVAGVHPDRRGMLALWLREHGAEPYVLESYTQLPLTVVLDEPGKVGIDRLLDAVAANSRRPAGAAAVIVDAGSAITVDLVDETGVFRGGAILPGLRLMAAALHEHTAQLPQVDVTELVAPPGRCTVEAIRVGISQTVIGGVRRIVDAYRRRHRGELQVFVTGGDGPILNSEDPPLGELWPDMTLMGILLSAQTHFHD
jgi:type III pantothenate kinase